MKRYAIVAAVVLALAGAGWFLLRGDDGEPLVLRGPVEQDGDGILLSYERSGGFTGEVVRFEVHEDGTTTIVKETAGEPRRDRTRLSEAKLEEITDLLVDAPWPATDTSYDEPNVAVSDGYVYDITYEGKAVFAPDLQPKWLMNLARDVEDLVLENA